MRIIKVSATHSTNSMARDWHSSSESKGPVVIIAREQTAGRGQRGSSWISNAGENLTLSIIYPAPGVAIQDQFLLSAAVGLGVIETLKALGINNLKLKWPNDIMAAKFKVGGILIENILSSGSITTSIIGIGLNVNQIIFPDLPRACSLRTLAGREFDLDVLMPDLVKSVISFLERLKEVTRAEILEEYEQVLFLKNKISTFELTDGGLLTGIIKGITPTGLLKVQVEDDKTRYFDLKELKLLF